MIDSRLHFLLHCFCST